MRLYELYETPATLANEAIHHWSPKDSLGLVKRHVGSPLIKSLSKTLVGILVGLSHSSLPFSLLLLSSLRLRSSSPPRVLLIRVLDKAILPTSLIQPRPKPLG